MIESKASVLIVEDDAAMAETLRQAAEDMELSATCVASMADAVEAARDQVFDLAILDRLLPDDDAIELISALRQSGAARSVLMVSALAHAQHRVDGLDRGADDYLAKPFAPAVLRACIRALLRRSRTDAPDIDLLVFGKLEIRVKARTVHFGADHIPVSPKEFDLLHYFATHADAPLSRMQLLEHVWNLHFDPQTNVVDVHVGRLRRKLETRTGLTFIHTARGEGYWFGLPKEDPAS